MLVSRDWTWMTGNPNPRRCVDCGHPIVVVFEPSLDGPRRAAYQCVECDGMQLIHLFGYRFTSVFPKPREVVNRVLNIVDPPPLRATGQMVPL